jgi:S-adenosylmethionine hydrolase
VRTLTGRWVHAFGQLRPGELGLLVDANGQVALVLDRASAAQDLHVTGPGAVVRIAPSPEDDDRP